MNLLGKHTHGRFFLAAALLTAALSGLLSGNVGSQELFKWTDASGKVHYGDRAAAPEDSKRWNVPVAPATTPSLPPLSMHAPLLARGDAQKKSIPVDAARVGSSCKGLADKIAAGPSGKVSQSLVRQFNDTCRGIAYECVEYRVRPQNNRCGWIEQTEGTIVNRKVYE